MSPPFHKESMATKKVVKKKAVKKVEPVMNKVLLRKIIRKIQRRPLTFSMSTWLEKADKENEGTPCGTVGCIAGWAVALSPDVSPEVQKTLDRFHAKEFVHFSIDNQIAGGQTRIKREAIRLLGITHGQARRLFFDDQWPVEFHREYTYPAYNEAIKLKNAKVAIRRIRHFIKTKGAE